MGAIDLTGQTFGRWTIIGRSANTPQGQAQWLCRCECGAEKVLKSIVIRRGLSRSCGCLKLEETIARSTRHGHSPASGFSPTYSTWVAMVKRCTNPNAPNYAHYGGRGIAVCDRWRDFANFLADMGEKPKGLTLERIDNDRGYEPGNCRWSTMREQGQNKRNNRRLTFRGETRCIAEWAEVTGIPASAISDRLGEGWSVEDALTKPAIGHRRFITFRGETKSLSEWAGKLGVTPAGLIARFKRGWALEQAMSNR